MSPDKLGTSFQVFPSPGDHLTTRPVLGHPEHSPGNVQQGHHLLVPVITEQLGHAVHQVWPVTSLHHWPRQSCKSPQPWHTAACGGTGCWSGCCHGSWTWWCRGSWWWCSCPWPGLLHSLIMNLNVCQHISSLIKLLLTNRTNMLKNFLWFLLICSLVHNNLNYEYKASLK